MPTDSTFKPNEEQKRKCEFFDRLRKERKEIYYTARLDKVDSDLNEVLTDTNLAMCMLGHLGKDIRKDAEEIMKTGKSIDDKVRLIAKCVKGKTWTELIKASERAVDEINVPADLVCELKRLKPTRLIIYTRVPKETASIYIRRRIDPLYNRYGEPKAIIRYATVLQYRKDVLTGEVLFIPDEDFRSGMRCRV